MLNETVKKSPIIPQDRETTASMPKNLPKRMDFLFTGLHNKVIIVPFSSSLDMVIVALNEARHRQQIIIVDIPISCIILVSSPKANKVKKKDRNISKIPPHIIK
ncbi:MAG: hypothetical protein QY310_02510 [Candidatus Jettenia sp. CY-1]|nr:MAG: hypothetical protein QY310_02510 [Candidatus Jettenia sp. CY-1]